LILFGTSRSLTNHWGVGCGTIIVVSGAFKLLSSFDVLVAGYPCPTREGVDVCQKEYSSSTAMCLYRTEQKSICKLRNNEIDFHCYEYLIVWKASSRYLPRQSLDQEHVSPAGLGLDIRPTFLRLPVAVCMHKCVLELETQCH
jgi:hypothetical protein